ncbi:hypothetical protein BDZ88DRAFT_46947 [Geranomyces variabilis]|nr:hypothetical protein BDZ88DRAFT_46947 [Geranomyces variabilis]KAJ3136210.1 hypothetical protein HDU90_003260 [Geranomyces variabilis]
MSADFTRSGPAPPASPSPQRSFSPQQQLDSARPPSAAATATATAFRNAAFEKDVVVPPAAAAPPAPAPTPAPAPARPSPPSAAAATTVVAIRCPSYPSDTFSVAVAADANIGALKLAVAAVVPGRPAVDEMRLIYSGKLLVDSYVVKDHLKTMAGGSPPIVHVVLTRGLVAEASVRSELRQRHVGDAAAASSATGATSASAFTPVLPPVHSVPPQQPPAVAYPAVMPQYQIVMVDGLPYAMQVPAAHPHPAYPYLQHHMPHAAAHHLPFHSTDPSLHGAPVAPAAAAPPVPQPPPAVVLPPVIDNEFGDAQRGGGAGEDLANAGGAPQNPFWLLLKLTFLLYVFSPNWSFAKIVAMHAVVLAIYLVQTRRRAIALAAAGANGGAGAQAVPAAAVVVAPAPAPAVQQPAAASEDAAPQPVNAAAGDNGETPTTPVASPPAPPQPTTTAVVVTPPPTPPAHPAPTFGHLAYMFFASLVPDHRHEAV